MAQAVVSIASARPKTPIASLAPWKQVVGSFLAVVSAYALYWLIAVPLIEPTLEPDLPTTRASEEELGLARNRVTTGQTSVARFFPEGAWERDRPTILEGKQTKLLFKAPRPLPDGTMELKPCTLLFFPKAGADAAADDARPIIMQVPAGARVRFDQPVALQTADLAQRRLTGAHLDGTITIYRQPSAPGANDDLWITTHDVEMTTDRIWTPHPVKYRLGRNHGSGRDMQILMDAPEDPAAPGLHAGAMRVLELKRDVVMFLELGSGPLAPAATAPAKPAKAEPPTRITCQGPFQYEMQRSAASFHDRVDVVRLNPSGPSDELNCELLTVLFESNKPASPPAEGAAPAAADQASSFRAREIQARGDPVTLRSPSQGIYVHCRGFDYAPGEAGAVGTLMAIGPGVMQGQVPNDPAGKYQVQWAREFRFEPEGTQHVAKLLGDAKVWYPQMGQIEAKEIFAWLTPKPAPPGAAPSGGSQSWQLERLLARGNVTIDARQLAGQMAELDATVERPQIAAAPAADGQAPPAQPKRQTPTQDSGQRYEVRGSRVQLGLLAEGDKMSLSTATIDKQAYLRELTPAEGQKPLTVQGDRLQISGASGDDTRATVVGRPGHIEAGGMTIDGREIQLEKRTNHLWVSGPGRMTMPIDQDLDGKTLAKPQLLDITWQGSMDFRSDTVVYDKAVLARSEQQFLRTERLQAVLNRPVDFANPTPPPNPAARSADRPQVAQIRCFGPALLQGRSHDERGVQTAFDRMEAADLAVDRISGDVAGRGPGIVVHVAFGTDDAFAPQPPTKPGAPPARPPEAKPREPTLRYLRVQFDDSLSGNLNRRVVTFGDQTTTVYGPIPNWDAQLDARDPDALPPQAMLLEAKNLTVRQMAPRTKNDRGWFELVAEGNVLGQGSNQGSRYTARGHQLTYSEQKEQLVLRGDGLSPAVFYQEDGAGNSLPTARGEALQYSLKQKHVQVAGFSNFNFEAPKAEKKDDNKPARPAGK